MALSFDASLARVVPEPAQSHKQSILRLGLLRGILSHWHARSRRNALRRPVTLNPESDDRPIGASRQHDADGVARSSGVVIAAKLVAQAASLDAHDGVGHRVERLGAAKDLKRDGIAFEPFAAPGERLVHNIFQELLPASRLDKEAACDNTVDLRADGSPVAVAPALG
jgi:hypothetical protein